MIFRSSGSSRFRTEEASRTEAKCLQKPINRSSCRRSSTFGFRLPTCVVPPLASAKCSDIKMLKGERGRLGFPRLVSSCFTNTHTHTARIGFKPSADLPTFQLIVHSELSSSRRRAQTSSVRFRPFFDGRHAAFFSHPLLTDGLPLSHPLPLLHRLLLELCRA